MIHFVKITNAEIFFPEICLVQLLYGIVKLNSRFKAMKLHPVLLLLLALLPFGECIVHIYECMYIMCGPMALLITASIAVEVEFKVMHFSINMYTSDHNIKINIHTNTITATLLYLLHASLAE